MKRILKIEKGLVTILLPIIVLPVLAFTYLAIEPMNDIKNGTFDGKTIVMEYENQIVDKPVPKVNPDNSIPKVKYKGYDTFGVFRIPKISLNQRVISKVTPDAIEVSCAYLYSTNGFNQIGNTVIIGHNYRNGKLFSNLTKLKVGDKLYLKTNGSNSEIEYTIYKTFITSSSDASFYNRDTSGKREITLSTCTDDVDITDNRLIILAREN